MAAGFRAPASFYEELRTGDARKRAWICEALEEAGMRPIRPEGAYHVLADVAYLGHPSARDAALSILREVGVASVPGSAFYRGATGERLLRFCYAMDEEKILEACRRFARLRR